MLTIHTPTTVRPHVEEATNERHARKHGAVGVVLEPLIVKEYVHSTLTEHECDADSPLDCGSVHVDELLLLQSPIGELAIIGTEGVGDAVDAELGTIPAYVAIGWQYVRVDLPHATVQRALTTEGADVADFIRLFGDRLDGNAFIWRRFVGA